MEKAFEKAGPAYWHTVNSLRARGGCCLTHQFPIVCGSPVARKKNLSPGRVLERLIDINLLERSQLVNDGQEYIQFKPHTYDKLPEEKLLATQLAETIALNGILDWARKIGLGSYNKFAIRDAVTLPIVSGVAWDLSAPSYLRPLPRITKDKLIPGFFVCDINLHEVIDLDFVAAFVRKHDTASAPQKVAPILPMLIGNLFQQDAHDLARRKGIMATTIADLFGTKIGKALQDLITLLSDSGARVAVNPEHLCKMLETLSKIEGSANNLRGALFEFVAGSLVKDVEGGYLVIGEKGEDLETGQKFEIDVLLDQKNSGRVVIIECKAKIPGSMVSKDEIKRWYENRIPLIFRTLSATPHYSKREFVFELWTNGTLHPNATTWLVAKPHKCNGYTVGWKDGHALKTYSGKSSSTAIRQALKDYYFNHPLAQLRP